jgi:hypothetical protein
VRLSAERCRAPDLLAGSRHVLAGLVRRKLAAAQREVVMAGSKTIEVARMRITAAGRRAIEG